MLAQFVNLRSVYCTQLRHLINNNELIQDLIDDKNDLNGIV